jgi:hypothetical protein
MRPNDRGFKTETAAPIAGNLMDPASGNLQTQTVKTDPEERQVRCAWTRRSPEKRASAIGESKEGNERRKDDDEEPTMRFLLLLFSSLGLPLCQTLPLSLRLIFSSLGLRLCKTLPLSLRLLLLFFRVTSLPFARSFFFFLRVTSLTVISFVLLSFL